MNSENLQEQSVLHESKLVSRVEAARSQDGLELVPVLVEGLLFRASGRIAQAAHRHLAANKQMRMFSQFTNNSILT